MYKYMKIFFRKTALKIICKIKKYYLNIKYHTVKHTHNETISQRVTRTTN
jgi:hypothetical protein